MSIHKYKTDSNGNYITGDGGFTTAKGSGAGSHHGGLVEDNSVSSTEIAIIVVVIVVFILIVLISWGVRTATEENSPKCKGCGRSSIWYSRNHSTRTWTKRTLKLTNGKCYKCRRY